MATATFRIWRTAPEGGKFQDYTAEVGEGMVVLDAVHQIQATQAPDLASYVVLSDSPTGISGRYLLSNSYDPGKTGNAGGNCDRVCSAQGAAAVATVLPCDVDAGRRYINVVSAASRMAATTRPSFDVTTKRQTR